MKIPSWRHPARRIQFASVVVAMMLLSGNGGVAVNAAPLDPVSQVQAAIQAAVKADRQPSTFTPSLASLATGPTKFTGASLVDRCSPRLHSNLQTKPTPCMMGAKSGPVWVLWGDSNAAAWIPALATAATTHKAQLAVFVFPGCKSRFVDGGESGFLNKVTICRTWHSALPAAIQTLKPSVVFSAELADKFSGLQSDVAEFASQWKSVFDAIVGPTGSAKRVLLEPTANMIAPNGFRRSIPGCLAAANGAKVLSCSGQIVTDVWQPGSYWTYLKAYEASASAANALLIPTSQLFCSTVSAPVRYCPAIVKTYSVYADEDHVTTAYMSYIGPALNQLLVQAGI